jgi:hypothetical protein
MRQLGQRSATPVGVRLTNFRAHRDRGWFPVSRGRPDLPWGVHVPAVQLTRRRPMVGSAEEP